MGKSSPSSAIKEAYALRRAERAGIRTIVIEESPGGFATGSLELPSCLGPDLILLAGFMRLLSSSIINSFPGRIMNIHPSLLPSFPGLQAQRQALEYGVKVTGCTVHFVDEGMDTGPVILQEAVPVLEGDDLDSLSERSLRRSIALTLKPFNFLPKADWKSKVAECAFCPRRLARRRLCD